MSDVNSKNENSKSEMVTVRVPRELMATVKGIMGDGVGNTAIVLAGLKLIAAGHHTPDLGAPQGQGLREKLEKLEAEVNDPHHLLTMLSQLAANPEVNEQLKKLLV
jgi:hypothetical protein